jgi:hypothetical protein
MGYMDTIYENSAPGKSAFLKGDDRETLVETRQPFNILNPVRFRTNPRFKDPKTGQPKEEWILDLRFLDTAGEVAEIDDGEGGTTTVDRTLTLGNTDFRARAFPQLQKLVADYAALGHANGLGPFYLGKQKVQGQANPAYMIYDWPPKAGDAGVAVAAAVPPPPPPSDRMRSPDGKWEWWPEKNQWLPVAENTPVPLSTLPDVIPVNPAAGGTVPFSKGADANLPAPGKSQPLPSTSQVTGGDGEGGTVTVTQAKGDEVRQAIYRGDGIVQTPQGGLIQAVAPEVPAPPTGAAILSPDGKHYLENGKWIKLPPLPGNEEPEPIPLAPEIVPAEVARNQEMEARGIAQEAPPPPPPPSSPPPPPPPPQGEPDMAGAVGAAQPKAKRKTIPMRGKCDTCGKQVQGAAFKNSKDRWILTHTCDAPDPQHPGQKIGSKTIDVHDQVVAILQEATS